MADFNINHITGKQGQQGTVLAGITTVSSTGAMRFPSGPTEQRGGGRQRGVFILGYAQSPGAYINTIEFLNIQTTGNSADFGDQAVLHSDPAPMSSSTRGVFASGNGPSGHVTTIDYVTLSSSGGASDFGDVSTGAFQPGGASDATRGVKAGGVITSPATIGFNIIEYVTIASVGDASEFGDLSIARWAAPGVNSPTRAVFGGGANPTIHNVIDYITIQTKGDAKDFVDILTTTRNVIPACSSTRGIYAGGYTPTYINVIQFLTISSLGNTSDFGDLTAGRARAAGMSNSIRGVFAGGQYDPGSGKLAYNTIDYITIASTGNAADFGDTTTACRLGAGVSGSHGGIGE